MCTQLPVPEESGHQCPDPRTSKAYVLSHSCLPALQHAPETMDVEMRKIMTGSGAGDDADRSPQTRLLTIVAVVAAAGFIAGLLGIGGALIFNPFLLQLGVHPQVHRSFGCCNV